MVPLTEENLTIDYIQESGYPLVFVLRDDWEVSTIHY